MEVLNYYWVRLYVIIMSRTSFRVNPHSILWPNGSVFVYELSCCWFESRCHFELFLKNVICFYWWDPPGIRLVHSSYGVYLWKSRDEVKFLWCQTNSTCVYLVRKSPVMLYSLQLSLNILQKTTVVVNFCEAVSDTITRKKCFSNSKWRIRVVWVLNDLWMIFVWNSISVKAEKVKLTSEKSLCSRGEFFKILFNLLSRKQK